MASTNSGTSGGIRPLTICRIDGCGPFGHEFAAHNIYGIFTGESSSEFVTLYQVSNAASRGP